MKKILLTVCVAISVLLADVAVSESRAASIPPAIASTNISALGVNGYDLVALFPGGSGNPNDGTEAMGLLAHRVVYKEVTYLFKEKANAERFSKRPEHYLPGIGGYCLLGMHRRAIGAPHQGDMPPVGDPATRTYAVVDGVGRWYFHGGKGAEEEFEKDPDTINERAAEAVKYYNRRLEGETGPNPSSS